MGYEKEVIIGSDIKALKCSLSRCSGCLHDCVFPKIHQTMYLKLVSLTVHK